MKTVINITEFTLKTVTICVPSKWYHCEQITAVITRNTAATRNTVILTKRYYLLKTVINNLGGWQKIHKIPPFLLPVRDGYYTQALQWHLVCSQVVLSTTQAARWHVVWAVFLDAGQQLCSQNQCEYRKRSFVFGSHLEANKAVVWWYGIRGTYINTSLLMNLALNCKPDNRGEV